MALSDSSDLGDSDDGISSVLRLKISFAKIGVFLTLKRKNLNSNSNLVAGALPVSVKRVRFGYGASLGEAAAFDLFYKNPPSPPSWTCSTPVLRCRSRSSPAS